MRYIIPAGLSILFLLNNFQLTVFGQQGERINKLSKTQKHLLKQIAKYGKVESKKIGYAAVYSEQYARFDSLAKISSENDIVLFTAYSSPAVKIYAFQKLLEQQNLNQAFVVLQNNFQDTTAFELQNDCAKGANIVGKAMYARMKTAMTREGVFFSDKQIILMSDIDKRLPNYGEIRKIITRQIRIRE